MLKKLKNMKIGIKILFVVLFMSLGTLTIVFVNAYISMDGLSDEFQKTNISLGLTASDDSKEALQSQAEEYLARIAQKQALYSNEELQEISRMVTVLAGYIEYLYENNERFEGRDLPLPDQTMDGEASSKYMLAPDVEATNAILREVRILSNCEAVFGPNLTENAMLDNIYVGTESGISYRFSTSNLYNASYDPRERTWYQEAADNPDETIWLDTYKDPYGHICITSAKAFLDAQGNVAGVIASDIKLQDMLDEITTAKIGQSGYAFVLDQEGTLIAHPDYFKDGFQQDIAAHIQIDSGQENVQALGESGSGIVNLVLDGVDSYVAYSVLAETGWSLCISVDKEEVVQPALDTKETIDSITDEAQELTQGILSDIMKKFIIFFAIVGIMVIMISFAVSGSITKPIQELSKNVERIGKGEFDRKIEVESSDEVGKLAAAFNNMLDDLHDYIDQITAITAEKERISAELQVAKQIQADMLPNVFPAFPERNEIDIFAAMNPAKEVGGDFYDLFMVDERHLAVVMADVSGKGVPAALFMVIGKTLIKNHTHMGISLGDVFSDVNNLLCDSNGEGMFITAFEGVLDLVTGEFSYVNAGHEAPYICHKEGDFEPYTIRPGFVLAGMEGMRYKEGRMQLEAGDKIFLYTDGVPEATDAGNKMYGSERLKNILNKHRNKTPEELLREVKADVDRFVQEAPQFDDITMLCLEYKEQMKSE